MNGAGPSAMIGGGEGRCRAFSHGGGESQCRTFTHGYRGWALRAK